MQRCPKCGYREGVDWPRGLCGVAFFGLCAPFIFGGNYFPRSLNLVWIAALVIFSFGDYLRIRREKRNEREYLKAHPSPAERLKSHINNPVAGD